MLVFGADVERKKPHMKPNLSGQYSVLPRKGLLGAIREISEEFPYVPSFFHDEMFCLF